MGKIIGIIASILIGNYFAQAQSPTLAIVESIAGKSRSIVLLLITSITLAILTASGVLLAIIGGGSWWYATSPEFTARSEFLFFAGLALVIFSWIGIAIALSRIRVVEATSRAPTPHPLQEQMLALVSSLTEERRPPRSERRREPPTPPPPPRPAAH